MQIIYIRFEYLISYVSYIIFDLTHNKWVIFMHTSLNVGFDIGILLSED